jgi:hypothetical protein
MVVVVFVVVLTQLTLVCLLKACMWAPGVVVLE